MTIRNIFTLLFMLCLTVFACKQENSPFAGNEKLSNIDKRYTEDPTAGIANEYMRELFTAFTDDDASDDIKKSYLLKGLKIAEDQNIPSRKASFLYPLVKDFNSDPETGNRILELAIIMKKLNKPEASSTLFKGIMDKYPNSDLASKASAELTAPISNIDEYLLKIGEKIFDKSEHSGLNRTNSLSYVDACEAYALIYYDSPNAPDNLFKAAEVAKSLRTYPKAMSLYNWILDKFPNYEKAPTTLFLKGFIVENNLGDDDQARTIYEEFLAKFPNHDLADDVSFLIENLGKSDEEILEMIEKRRQENQ